jgi:hypothetical protein
VEIAARRAAEQTAAELARLVAHENARAERAQRSA